MFEWLMSESRLWSESSTKTLPVTSLRTQFITGSWNTSTFRQSFSTKWSKYDTNRTLCRTADFYHTFGSTNKSTWIFLSAMDKSMVGIRGVFVFQCQWACEAFDVVPHMPHNVSGCIAYCRFVELRQSGHVRGVTVIYFLQTERWQSIQPSN